MKQIRKLLSLVLLLACGAMIGIFLGVNSLSGLLDFAKEIIYFIVEFLVSWNDLSIWVLVAKIGAIVVNALLVVLALISLIKSLVKCKKKCICGPLDSLNSLVLVLVFIIGECALFEVITDKKTIAIIAGSVGLFVLLFEIATLILTKPQKKVELEAPKVEETEEVVEEAKEEAEVKEEPVQETANETVAPCSFLGKTLQVSDGNNVIKVVVVEVNDSQVVPVVPVSETKKEVVEDTVSANAVVESNDEEDEEEGTLSNERKPSLSYVQRLEQSEDSLKEVYSTLKNELLKHRKVHARISKSCETFRVGYDEVAKIVVAGKSLKLYLALDPFAVDSAIYHQRDASSKKRFQQVPFVVKVKSPLSVKKACQLINLTCEKKEIQPKSRYEEVDYSHIEVGQ